MMSRAAYQFFTAKGVAEEGQHDDLAELTARLSDPGAKVLLHLHGGLVDRGSGVAGAARLSGSGDKSFGLKDDWTQIYVIWQTGAFEEIERRWTELAEDDRLYQSIVRKLISFLAQRLRLPLMDGRSAAEVAPLSDDEILARIRGEGDRRDPFKELEAPLRVVAPSSRASLAPDRSTGALLLEFNTFLLGDPLFRSAVSDLDAAVNMNAVRRSGTAPASMGRGEAILERLGEGVKLDFDLPHARGEVAHGERAAARGIVSVGAFVIGRAMKVAMRCIERFRTYRDHGLHATIVEEVCREFYGDKIGAKIWGWMVDDARLHFEPNGFGEKLQALLAENPPSRLVVTAHSAGSIWASRMLLAMAEAGATTTIDLCLLAPAVREDLFATVVEKAAGLVRRCHMFTMDDGLERADAVLGHDKGFVYPSSLLYLVSGLFESREGDAYADAPILGMQRFVGVDWLSEAEARDATAISDFFSQTDKGIHYSKGSGLTDADAHGDFDDNILTLGSVNAQFLT